MEYCSGKNLRDIIDSKDWWNIPSEKKKKYVSQILDGLIYIHEQKIIHRDLKPGNILMNEDDLIKICDFGLATTMTQELVNERN